MFYIRNINQEIGLTKAFCESKITINKAKAMKRIRSCKLFLTENCRLMRGVKVDLQRIHLGASHRINSRL